MMLKCTLRLFALLMLGVLASGCAPKVQAIKESHSTVWVSFSRVGDGPYYLVNKHGKLLGSAKPSSGVAIFKLPEGSFDDDCLYVLDEDREPLSDGAVRFRPALAGDHLRLIQNRDRLAKLVSNGSDRVNSLSSRVSRADWALRSNRAYQNGTCALPEQRPVPAPPIVRCSNRAQCERDATTLCYTIAFGAEGCSIAMRQKGLPSTLGGPACAAAASKLAHEDYAGDQLAADFVRGVVDDVADHWLNSDSVVANVVGFFVKGANYASKVQSAEQCKTNFVARNYGPYDRWLDTRTDIINEPGRLLYQCNSQVDEKTNASRLLGSARIFLNDSKRQLDEADNRVKKQEMRINPVALGCH